MSVRGMLNICALTSRIDVFDEKAEAAGTVFQSGVPIVMCGCVPSRYADEGLSDELPEIAAFVRHDEEDFAALLAQRKIVRFLKNSSR